MTSIPLWLRLALIMLVLWHLYVGVGLWIWYDWQRLKRRFCRGSE